MLHNRILKKEDQVHKTKNVAENDRLCIEINTLHWVIAQQSLSVRRLLTGQHSKLSYDTNFAGRWKEERRQEEEKTDSRSKEERKKEGRQLS